MSLFHVSLFMGSRSTFEFPSRVNSSGPSLYCIARSLGKWSRHSIGLADATRLKRSDFRMNLLLLKGQRCVYFMYPYFMCPYSMYPYSMYPYSMYPHSMYSYSMYPYSMYPYYLIKERRRAFWILFSDLNLNEISGKNLSLSIL